MKQAFRSLFVSLSLALLVAGCASAGFGKGTRNDIKKQMNSVKPDITNCYKSALQRDRKLKGEMVLLIRTDPKTGRFHRAKVKSGTIRDAKLERCILQSVTRLKLKKPTTTSVVVDYPLEFKSTKPKD